MNAQATINITIKPRRILLAVYESLLPESISSTNQRSHMEITYKDDVLTLDFKASDTSALRAVINSYLRFAFLSKQIVETIH
jgi:tRNA threonylcarbamoyladenosine modification (KEOPS) complex  Pcc1 subunit